MNPFPPRHPDDTDVRLVEPYDELSEPSGNDDIFEELAKAQPRHWRTRTTATLAMLVLLVGGFLAGSQVEKHWGASATTAAGPNVATFPRPNFSGNPQGASAGPAASGAITGTVKLVDGDTVYITTSDGQTIVVKTSASTVVRTTKGGSLSDLTSGSTVSIEGQTGSDGSVTATTITRAK
jgi:hypothetical protein